MHKDEGPLSDRSHEGIARVCIVCASLPPYYGGAELRAYRFAERLQMREGVEATLVGWDRIKNRSEGDGFPSHVHPVHLRFSGSPRASASGGLTGTVLHVGEAGARLGWCLVRLRHQFDIVHVINTAVFFNLLAVPFAKILNKPVILEMTLLGSDDPLKLNKRGRNQGQQLFPHRPVKYSLFLMADAYVSKSTGLSQAYGQAGLPERKLFQIPSGVDTETFCPPQPDQKADLRHRLGLPADKILILFVGGIEERKGAHRLLVAFQQMAPGHPKVHLVIVGPADRFEASYVERVRHDIQAWGLDGQVTFREGLATNVEEYMKAADIFALPSSREGFSMAVLEAMATGLAIVASDIPEVSRSQIEDEVEGLLTRVGNKDHLIEALTKLVDNEALRASFGAAVRQRALREFTFEVIDSQYIRLYHDCMNQ